MVGTCCLVPSCYHNITPEIRYPAFGDIGIIGINLDLFGLKTGIKCGSGRNTEIPGA